MSKLKVPTDKEGYLKHLSDWSETAACVIAQEEGIDLSVEHWDIIWLLRDVYQEYQHTPVTRVFVKVMAEKLGPDKGRSIYLLRLFPETPMRKACKIAGLPKPTNCI